LLSLKACGAEDLEQEPIKDVGVRRSKPPETEDNLHTNAYRNNHLIR
jgi:hypothetical protein